jgi:hypothetical protein
VAAAEDGGQTHTGGGRLDDGEMDLVVDDVAVLLEVDRVDDLVGAVFLSPSVSAAEPLWPE